MPSEERNITQWVYKLYELGYTPIPLKAHNKTPNIPEIKPYQYKRPDKKTIDNWVEHKLYENIGLMLGEVHGGLYVFDFDRPESFKALNLEPEKLLNGGFWLTETPQEQGRYHLGVTSKNNCKITCEKRHGVEARGNKHYVAFYPSIHPNGEGYNLLNTHKPEELEKPTSVSVEKMWKDWVTLLDKHYGTENKYEKILSNGQYDNTPACIKNAWEQGAKNPERNDTIIGLSSWLNQTRYPKDLIKSCVKEWYNKKCGVEPVKPESKVLEAIETGWTLDTKCRWWRTRTEFCPYKEQVDCPFFYPDSTDREELLKKYNVVYKDENDNTKINNIRLGKAIEERGFNFKRLFDENTGQDDLCYYSEGYYHRGGGEIIKGEVDEFLGDLSSDFRRQEAMKYITVKLANRIDRNKFEPALKHINLNNGIYNLETGQLKPHEKNFYFINKLPIDFNAKADCPKIKKFFSEVLYEEDIPLIQEMFGYSLYRKYIIHVAFVLFGFGRNGKGVCDSVLESFLGSDNISTRKLHTLEEDKFAKADLYGRMANIGGEISSKKLKDSGDFKNLCGGESLTGERKYKGSFNFHNYAKLIFNANTLPDHIDKTHAFYERWVIVPFPHTFDRGNKKTNPHLIEELTTPEELSGLFNWAVEGLKRVLEKSDFSYNSEINNIPKYEYYRTPEKTFISTYFENDRSMKIDVKAAYRVYEKWGSENKHPIATQTQFTQTVKREMSGVQIKDTTKNGIHYKYYLNIMWKERPENEEKNGSVDKYDFSQQERIEC